MNEAQLKAGQGAGALRWLWLSVVIVAADQVTKWLVTQNLALYERIELLPVLGLTHLHNTGAAFSFLADAGGWQRWFFIAIAVLVTVLVCFWLSRMPARGQGWLAAALALVVGGAVGNVIDRVAHGYVIDFISVHWERSFFPAFNVADSAITVGAAILIIDSFYESRRKQKVI
ncbi:signal peptidase II [Thioalkalivibrio sp. XN279]|uniref:signal peptidase II n=1 Tax=Thioalkalivibrio sp. XN279 TaxID=2714953 RepID=UPI001409A4AB|nr:signal peptidase II [Thioalkalivibrio sp. XN279]NHA14906.1 lipoprotein signal peptidase [Thioalkalivibrio sp. XN279]